MHRRHRHRRKFKATVLLDRDYGLFELVEQRFAFPTCTSAVDDLVSTVTGSGVPVDYVCALFPSRRHMEQRSQSRR
jgi:hypothetical protein